MDKELRDQLELEFTYTSYDMSCKDPAIMRDEEDLRECRRNSKHEGRHASGFGKGMRQW